MQILWENNILHAESKGIEMKHLDDFYNLNKQVDNLNKKSLKSRIRSIESLEKNMHSR